MSVSVLPRSTSTLISTSSAAQQTQNTAPIIEHQCLYTHDLRRKAKRWQDGFLRYHTFNKRVMVYDVPRNYIGDSHWREEYPLQDGDELELDRPVLVQVGEQVGMAEQDLTALFQKRQKKVPVEFGQNEDRASSPAAAETPKNLQTSVVAPYQLQPKSLNTLLGTPKGRIGKARLPTKSPYDLRIDGEEEDGRTAKPVKRRRIESAIGQRTEGTIKAPIMIDSPQPQLSGSPIQVTHRASKASKSSHRRDHSENPSLALYPTSFTNVSGASIPCAKERSPLSVSSPTRSSHATNLGLRQDQLAHTHISRSEDHPNVRNPGQPGEISMTRPGHVRSEQGQRQSGSPSPRLSVKSSTPQIASRENGANDAAEPKMKSKLQIASRKPRRKLMCTDVVEQEVSVPPKPGRGRKTKAIEVVTPALQMKGSHESPAFGRDASPQVCAELLLVADEPRSSPKDSGKAQPRSHGDMKSKHINASDRSSYSHSDIDTEPATRRVRHDTALALAKMDEILDSRSQCPPQKKIPTPFYDDLSSRIERHSPSSKTRTPPDLASSIGNSSHALPVTQVPSSPLAQMHAESLLSQPALPGASGFHLAVPNGHLSDVAQISLVEKLAVDGSSQPSQLAREASPTQFSDFISTKDSAKSPKSSYASPVLNTGNLLEPPIDPPNFMPGNKTNLPTFKMPQTISKPRSPLRKSVSDTSAAIKSYNQHSESRSETSVSLTASAERQGINPWSKEAWDLFGCGEDGVAVGFKEFCQGMKA